MLYNLTSIKLISWIFGCEAIQIFGLAEYSDNFSFQPNILSTSNTSKKYSAGRIFSHLPNHSRTIGLSHILAEYPAEYSTNFTVTASWHYNVCSSDAHKLSTATLNVTSNAHLGATRMQKRSWNTFGRKYKRRCAKHTGSTLPSH